MHEEETNDETWRDPIVEEIRKVREAHAAKFNYDLEAIAADFQSREREGPYRVVSFPPRRPATAKPAE